MQEQPAERAKDIVDKMQRVCGSSGNGIAAALICCDEIMADKYKCGCEQSVVIGWECETCITYWQQVKIEIEKL